MVRRIYIILASRFFEIFIALEIFCVHEYVSYDIRLWKRVKESHEDGFLFYDNNNECTVFL